MAATGLTQQRGGRVSAPAPRPAPERVAVRRRLARRADLVGTAGIAVVVTAAVLWLHGGGLSALHTPGGPTTSIGRLSGLLASALLLLQVLLMARIPWLEAVWGQDTLARWHRRFGMASFYLMVGHIATITLGYAQSAHVNLLSQAWDLVVNYPAMLLAAAGTLALLMVVATSIRAARRRLRYESWHLLHLYAYLGVGLALPHQLWTGTDFTSSTVATVFWWGLWGAAALAILLFRLVLPIARSVRHRLRVLAIIDEGPGVTSVVLSGRALDRLGVQAGQFCQWRFLAGPGRTRSHPYSLSAPPTANRIRLTVKDLGDGSAALAGLAVGTRVLFEGPHGVMTADRRLRRDALLIGAGIGITPLRALAERIAFEAPGPDWNGVRRPAVTVLHRISTAAGALFAAEFAELGRRAGAVTVPIPGRRGPGSSFLPGPGPVDARAALFRLVPDLLEREVYVCGPGSFLAEVRSVLRAAGVPAGQVHAEEFAW